MPVETRISAEFGRLVSEAMGTDSYGQGTIKTGISQAYLFAMKAGKVPSREVVEKFATGYSADLQALRIAAGYEEPTDIAEQIALKLRTNGQMSEDGIDQVRRFIDKVIQKNRKQAQ
jgi:hypothetical protein